MKNDNLKKRGKHCLKHTFFARAGKAAGFSLLILIQCLTCAVCTANPYVVVGTYLAGATLIKEIFGGTSTVTHYMMVFDKTYTRKYFGVEVSDKYLMNVLQSGKVVYKHTYTRKFPEEKVPLQIADTNSWEYNAGGTESGDHQIEVRDFVCQQGGDYSGMDIDLKVSFTMKVKWTTESMPILRNRARVTISGWDDCPVDCTGLPTYNVGSLIDWSAEILKNGESQVIVSPTKPSFKVNRSYGRDGSIAVTVN